MKTKPNLEVFMEDEKKQQRIFAVQRFNMSESTGNICCGAMLQHDCGKL
jgi:hypothetical protein